MAHEISLALTTSDKIETPMLDGRFWRNIRSTCFWEPSNLGAWFRIFQWGLLRRRRCRHSRKVRMTINGYLMVLRQPRMWVAVGLLVSQVLQFGPCCCWRQHGSTWRGHAATQSAKCCCDAVSEGDASDDFGIVAHDEVCEAPLPHKCRCNKNVCVGAKPELFTVADHRANFFDDLARPIAPIPFNVGDARALRLEGGRRDVVALRGADCCTVLCRWLC